jgi:hypothetical protein
MLPEPIDASGLISDLMPRLGADDNAAFWATALSVITEEMASHIDEQTPCFLEVGVCSHWLRPHQARWTVAGGFAWPSGYLGGSGQGSRGLPEFDWSALFRYESGILGRVEKYSEKRRQVMRVAFPARTARHHQAVLHVLWHPSKRLVFFGFRRVGDGWKLVATLEQNEKSVVAK